MSGYNKNFSMLVVKTIIKPSTIRGAGIGLFADQEIRRGCNVWVYNKFFDISYPPNTVSEMNDAELDFFYTYAFLSKVSGRYILSVDNSHFCNHSSDRKNLAVRFEGAEHIEYACRDIQKGEELLIDYRDFDANEQSCNH